MLKFLSHICLVLLSICYFYGLDALVSDAQERQLMRELAIAAQFKGGEANLHTQVVRLRDYLLTHYIQPPKSDKQREAWKATRTFLRQPAMATVEGKPALCGELARLAVKVLRAGNIESRRLYLYKSPATNHVIFEYFNKEANAWRVMDSYGSTAYLRLLLDTQALGIDDMLRRADPSTLVYDKYGYLPQTLFFQLGEARARAVPYAVSWWYEEVFLIRAIAYFLAGVVFTGMYYFFCRLDTRKVAATGR